MSNRIKIINSEIQKALSEIITYELKNPKISGIISVIKAETTPDLDYCKVLISIYADEDKQEIFNQIKHSAGFIRKQLSQKVKIRKVPYLIFNLDTSYDDKEKIENLLAKINEEKKETNEN